MFEMAQNVCLVLLWLGILFQWPSVCLSVEMDGDVGEDRWVLRHPKPNKGEPPCSGIRPTAQDIVRRFYAILPYFDKDHTSTAFLHKYRSTVYGMSGSEDSMDREAGFYAAVITPIVFLQQYRDTWCLLERFHRAIRLYQDSPPSEKRSYLELLQNLRSINKKVRSFVMALPGPSQEPRAQPTTAPVDTDEDEIIHDKKDFRYFKEMIKNLG